MKQAVHVLVFIAVVLYLLSWLFAENPQPLPEVPPTLGG